MFDEVIYVLDKKGDAIDRILDVLINSVDNFEEAIKYLISKLFDKSTFDRSKQLWAIIHKEALSDPNKLKIMIKYADYYSDPESLIGSIPKGATIKDMKE